MHCRVDPDPAGQTTFSVITLDKATITADNALTGNLIFTVSANIHSTLSSISKAHCKQGTGFFCIKVAVSTPFLDLLMISRTLSDSDQFGIILT
jgi:hypothetical protein